MIQHSLCFPVKVLKGPVYEARLAEYATIFTNRQKDIEFALLVHTTLSLDSAIRTLSDVHESVRSTDDKFNMVLLFRRLDSPGEKELIKLVESKGGPQKCMEDDNVLLELDSFRRGPERESLLVNSEPSGFARDFTGYPSFTDPIQQPQAASTSRQPETVYHPVSYSFQPPVYNISSTTPVYQPSGGTYQRGSAPVPTSYSYQSPIYPPSSAIPVSSQWNPGLQTQSYQPNSVHVPTSYSLPSNPLYVPSSQPYVSQPAYLPSSTLYQPYSSPYYQSSPGYYSSNQPHTATAQQSTNIPKATPDGPSDTQSPAVVAVLEALKAELNEDVGKTFKKNMVVFERKLDVQRRLLVTALTDVVQWQGDRVITAVVSGPHDRIVDAVRVLLV